jgi:hypothetical protein
MAFAQTVLYGDVDESTVFQCVELLTTQLLAHSSGNVCFSSPHHALFWSLGPVFVQFIGHLHELFVTHKSAYGMEYQIPPCIIWMGSFFFTVCFQLANTGGQFIPFHWTIINYDSIAIAGPGFYRKMSSPFIAFAIDRGEKIACGIGNSVGDGQTTSSFSVISQFV